VERPRSGRSYGSLDVYGSFGICVVQVSPDYGGGILVLLVLVLVLLVLLGLLVLVSSGQWPVVRLGVLVLQVVLVLVVLVLPVL
jgi:hypothetical protein